jgi:hypothetical protein
MRRTWRDRGSRVVIDFSSDVIWLDITDEKGSRLFAGDWDIELSRNGKPVTIDVAWSEVCWFTDDDVDYLELECDLDGTCTIQRQIMLMREEGIVTMADAVIADAQNAKASEWTVRSSWQLDPEIELTPAGKSTEAWLKRVSDEGNGAADESVALLLPIAFPEWQRSPQIGSLRGSEGHVVLEVRSNQPRIYNPLVVALRGIGKSPPLTWRNLTVAQDLELVGRDVAQAFRLQIGKEQWVLYRSLTPRIRRTVMGLHLNTEFYAARFQASDGTYEALIEVNPE